MACMKRKTDVELVFDKVRYKMKDYLIQKAKGETYDNLR